MLLNRQSILGGFLFGAVRHAWHLYSSPDYRALAWYHSRYSGGKRYQEQSVRCMGRTLLVPDAASFLSMYEEICINRIYESKQPPHRLLDIGANIGMSVLWFKQCYPRVEVVGYEADPCIYRYLEKNVGGMDGVTLHHAAVWSEDGELNFLSEGADAGRVEDVAGIHGTGVEKVPAVDIRRVLQSDGPFDYIKMDIEGAESVVLPHCRGLLGDTRYLFCEYHSLENKEQTLGELVVFLKDEGFRVHLQPVGVNSQPFLHVSSNAGFDMQINIYAWKA